MVSVVYMVLGCEDVVFSKGGEALEQKLLLIGLTLRHWSLLDEFAGRLVLWFQCC